MGPKFRNRSIRAPAASSFILCPTVQSSTHCVKPLQEGDMSCGVRCRLGQGRAQADDTDPACKLITA